MRTIEITEAEEWKQTLIDVAQSLQDKAAINGELSEWDKRVYDEVVEIEKKLDSIEQKESKSAREYIINEWGESWLTNDWQAGDVMDALEEYAQQPQKVEQEEKPTDERSILIKFLEFEDNINMAVYAEPEDIVDNYLKMRDNPEQFKSK